MDINELDFENIGSWPAAAHAGAILIIFLAILGLGYFFHIESMLTALDTEKNREQELKSKLSVVQKGVVNLDDFRKYLDDMTANFEGALSQLPAAPGVADLIDDLTQKALQNQLTINSISPGAQTELEFYTEMDIALTVDGGYHQLGNFVNVVASTQRIVSLHDVNLSPKDPASGLLTMTAKAKIYWYETEGDEQKGK